MTVDLQSRTVRTLVAGQAVGALGITIGIATASLLAKELSGSQTLAGTAQTTQVLGAATVSAVLARVMNARGRRFGMTAGLLTGAFGAGLAVVAGIVGSIALLLLGTFLLGAVTSVNLAARYAATDLAEPERAGRDLSLVVWASTVGAVLGPNLTGPAAAVAHRLSINQLTGPFAIGATAMLAAALIVFTYLRPDPLVVARERAAVTKASTARVNVANILRDKPILVAAMGGMATAHAVMVSVMAMTPLHMSHGGAQLKIIGFVISLHVLGMFAFSPVVGLLVDHIGAAQVLGIGGVVLLASLVASGLSPQGNSPAIVVGLFLLGLGWSLATVAAATIIATNSPTEARTSVQGTADVLMSTSAAVASVFSGLIVGTLGFPALAGFAAVFALAVVASALSARPTNETYSRSSR